MSKTSGLCELQLKSLAVTQTRQVSESGAVSPLEKEGKKTLQGTQS